MDQRELLDQRVSREERVSPVNWDPPVRLAELEPWVHLVTLARRVRTALRETLVRPERPDRPGSRVQGECLVQQVLQVRPARAGHPDSLDRLEIRDGPELAVCREQRERQDSLESRETPVPLVRQGRRDLSGLLV